MRATVLFDLDNTLTHRPDTIRAYAQVLAADFSRDLAPDTDPRSLGDTLVALDANHYSQQLPRTRQLLAQDFWRSKPSAATLLEHWRDWVPAHPVPMPGMHPLLSHLRRRGCRLGLVTNGDDAAQGAKIAALEIGQYFDAILISGACGMQKPDKAIFERALRELGARVAKSFFVGDHPVNDCHGARGAGLRPIWLSGFHPWPAELDAPEFTVANLQECAALLDTLISDPATSG